MQAVHRLRRPCCTGLLCALWLGCAVQAQAAPARLKLEQRFAPASLAGQQGEQRLSAALLSMLIEHPDVLKAQAALESAGHDLSSARGARWPSFKIGTSGGNAQLRQTRESYSTVNAEVRMNLLDGGAIGAGIRSAESLQAAQTSVLYGARQNVLLEALTALLEWHRFDSKARIAAESARIIGQLARIEERRAELGAVGRNDLRQAASRRAGALGQQHALEAQRMDALARFTRYFNFRPENGWLPALQVPAQWMPASENAALQASEAHSPELREMEQQIAKAEAEVERSKAQRFPTLAAVVAHTRDPKGVLYADGTRYGVELNWNFGNGFELRDRILKAINELQAQQAQQEAVRRQVRETASAAWGRTQAGHERETQLADAVREARATFEGRRRLLEVGRGSLAQVLDAQLDMQRLMLDEADAIYDQRINELRLVRTTGQLLPPTLPEHWLDKLFAAPPPSPAAPASRHAQRQQPAPRPQLRLASSLNTRRLPPYDRPPISASASW
ncbi:TolC family protein [Comamonas composti]|uniref:TolC family protein n=1 Tax=Comamonas composti TaxID=408558 RepID=UPI000405740E|nr:TolC family protein [Comamonas composti]